MVQALAAELQNTELRQWQQDRILKNYVIDFQEFLELTLFSAEGGVLATSRIGDPRLSVPAVYEGNAPQIAPITVDNDFLPTTTVTIPLTRFERRTGWLMGELNLEELWRMVDRIRVGSQGFALVVTRDGRLIAHGNPDEKPRVATGEDLSQHGLLAAIRQLEEDGGHQQLDREGRARSSVATFDLEYPDERGRRLLGADRQPELDGHRRTADQ